MDPRIQGYTWVDFEKMTPLNISSVQVGETYVLDCVGQPITTATVKAVDVTTNLVTLDKPIPGGGNKATINIKDETSFRLFNLPSPKSGGKRRRTNGKTRRDKRKSRRHRRKSKRCN
jgi:hypothetical protein